VDNNHEYADRKRIALDQNRGQGGVTRKVYLGTLTSAKTLGDTNRHTDTVRTLTTSFWRYRTITQDAEWRVTITIGMQLMGNAHLVLIDLN